MNNNKNLIKKNKICENCNASIKHIYLYKIYKLCDECRFRFIECEKIFDYKYKIY